jgi:cyclophilin family peptidyl-prolyl cis-trans isomerase
MVRILLSILIVLLTSGSLLSQQVKVRIKTTEGDIIVKLYDDTPIHRDNFIKLVKKHYYDSLLFHRVIKGFMIQTGDPFSKNAKPGSRLGLGGPGYTLPAEIRAQHFHKRGALAAARQSDDVNPERRSSGSQFYIVQGRKYTPEQLDKLEKRLKAIYRNDLTMKFLTDKSNKAYRDTLDALAKAKKTDEIIKFRTRVYKLALKKYGKKDFAFTPEQRKIYTTVGGAPHLDGQYTVFGEVIKGMDVVDKIAGAKTDIYNRPLKDIRILKVEIVK